MSYKCVDELDKISIHDAAIGKIYEAENNAYLALEFDGAVIREGNSANEYFADKYCDTLTVKFKNPVIQAILLEGHKLYDANENLIEQVPDKAFDESEYDRLLKLFEGCVVFYGGIPKEKLVENFKNDSIQNIDDKQVYQMIIDVEDESYIISIIYDSSVATWEKYMNKAYNV